MRDDESHREFDLVFPVGGFGREGQEGQMAWEEEVYFNMCWRWRNLPKPVIAAAQGKTIAGGLMLLWVADIIIAADDAMFTDPVVGMGVNGVEYFAHPWELGPRKAKEMLFTKMASHIQDFWAIHNPRSHRSRLVTLPGLGFHMHKVATR